MSISAWPFVETASGAPGVAGRRILTAPSCVPSLALCDDVATKGTLAALDLVAATIAVPALARHAH